MNGETGFLHSFVVWSVPVCGGLLRTRGGARYWAHLRAADLYSVGSFDPDHDAVIRIGGEAPGGGPILPVGISAMFEYGFPPPRIVNSAVVLKSTRAPNIAKRYAVPVSPFRMLDVRPLPPTSHQ